ncbi:MAG: RDD family protein [Solirubrobacteraceae bacterium]|nr:RDD family protein [Solirubrobacteraceae bacterium]
MKRPSFKRLLKPPEPGRKDIAPKDGGFYRPIASLAVRGVVTMLVDAILLLPLFGVLHAIARATRVEVHDAVLVWAAGALYLGATTARRGAHRGQTPGKQLAELRVVRARDGAPIGAARAWMRGAVVALLLPLGYPIWAFALEQAGTRATDTKFGTAVAIGALSVTVLVGLLSNRRQTPHDLLFWTTVCEAKIVRGREPVTDPAVPAPYVPRPDDPRQGLPLTIRLGRRKVDAGDVMVTAVFAYLQIHGATEYLR